MPAESWEGVLPTQEDERICVQEYEAKGSEDCLYINVFTPNVSISMFLFSLKNKILPKQISMPWYMLDISVLNLFEHFIKNLISHNIQFPPPLKIFPFSITSLVNKYCLAVRNRSMRRIYLLWSGCMGQPSSKAVRKLRSTPRTIFLEEDVIIVSFNYRVGVFGT